LSATKRYFLLEKHPEIEWGAVGNPTLPSDVSFLRGAWITRPMPTPVVVTVDHPAMDPPKGLVAGPVPVVQRALLDLLLRVGGDNVQTFAARLENPSANLRWDDYAAVNVIGLVDAVDMAQSVFATLLGGGVVPPLVDFDRIVLRADRTHGLRMFRVPQSPALWFVDGEIVQSLRDNRPATGWGIAVRPVEVQ
jgi:hypothetical protein